MTSATHSEAKLRGFRRRVRRWYREHGRHGLPWRQTRDPYAVLVSELMLQQTQVDRVLPYYERWMRRWPTAASLAAATPAEVIREWAGLGYNRRALNLHHAAVRVVEDHDGAVPVEPAALRALPGIGPYTANAVASFAGERRVAVADTNIGRVLARVFSGQASMPASAAAAVAEDVLPTRKTRDWNLALMDLGAMVCRARAPRCDTCPVARLCAWKQAGCPAGTGAPPATAPRFETTARFARGRIVDALREVAMLPRDDIEQLLPPGHRERAGSYLAALECDGLVEQAGDGCWRLPGGGSVREG